MTALTLHGRVHAEALNQDARLHKMRSSVRHKNGDCQLSIPLLGYNAENVWQHG